MTYISVSFTHKNTDINLREKLSFNTLEKKYKLLKSLNSNKNILESMVLSTCNRVEVLAYVDDIRLAQDFIILEISQMSGVSFDELNKRADVYENTSAIHHLFSVASSLDSLVVGETQIVGQLKDAYNYAKNSAFCSEFLQIAILASLRCAAKIRNETNISKNPVSIPSVAVSLAKERLRDLKGVNALVIGAGEMAELICKNLINLDTNITLINRSEARALMLAKKLENKICIKPIKDLEKEINKNTLIFSATNSCDVIISDKMLKNVNFKRYFFDIAVPRDINITKSEANELFFVDDLDLIVKKNLSLREEEASKAYLIVSKETTAFFDELNNFLSTPAIKALRKRAKDISEIEIKKAIKKGYIKHCDELEVKKLIHQVFKAFLHTPTINLKKTDKNSINSIVEIFELLKEK